MAGFNAVRLDETMEISRISIVGGGIGGLTAALALQHFGYVVSVFEQARELREIGAGVTITPNAMHALHFLGVGERVAREAGPTEANLVRHFHTGEIIKVRANGRDYVERFGADFHQVHRGDLLGALADAVFRNDPDCVSLEHCFETLTQDHGKVLARFTNGSTTASDVLIGCDGSASKVRADVFGDKAVNYTGQIAFRALLPIANVPAVIAERPFAMFVGVNRMLLHYPLRHRSIMNVVGISRELAWQEEGWQIPSAIEEFASLYDDLYPEALELIRRISPGSLFKWGLHDREPLQQYTKGRVTMLGDAAHPMSPFLGQGACMAIEDALILGRAFAAATTPEEAFRGLRKYTQGTRQRRPTRLPPASR